MQEVKKPSKRPLIFYYLVGMLILMVLNMTFFPTVLEKQVQEVSYSTFMSMTYENNIGLVQIEGDEITFTDKAQEHIYKTVAIESDSDMVQRVYDHGGDINRIDTQPGLLTSILVGWVLPLVPFLLIGLADDIAKYLRHYSDGLSSLSKLILQLAASVIVAYAICDRAQGSLEWYIYYPVAVLFITATVNALNITDGLDSLATKVSMPALLMAAVCFPALRSANLVLFTALAAWLIFNSPKASIFMGDGGSHFIGAFLALDGLVSGSVPSLLIALLPAYIELLSSFVQIVSIRLFGRKIFLIAPLHHDLEKRGLGEAKITDIFLSLSVFSSLLSAMLFSEVL